MQHSLKSQRFCATVVMTKKRRRVYDHRIKEAIIRSRNAHLFPELKIPPSTARAWIQRGIGQVVSLHQNTAGEDVLRDRSAALERREGILSTLLRLTMVLTRISGCRLDRQRLPDSIAKAALRCMRSTVHGRSYACLRC